MGPTATVTATRTPTGVVATPTRTLTGQATPTNTSTRAPTATATVAQTGLATSTATATGNTPTATPRITPTVTPTPGGSGLSWLVNGSPATTVSVPQNGMGFAQGAVILVDSQMRFCSEESLRPVLNVDVVNNPVVGAFPVSMTSQPASHVGIANIPAAPQPGTVDLLVHTRLGCQPGTQPTILRFPGAITYGGP
jgi:hypothetical protein